MTDYKDKWQQELRDALERSSSPEPELLWASLEPHASAAAEKLRRIRNRRRLLWGSAAGFAAAAIAALVFLTKPSEGTFPSGVLQSRPLYAQIPSELSHLNPLRPAELISPHRITLVPSEAESNSEEDAKALLIESYDDTRSAQEVIEKAEMTDTYPQDGQMSIEDYLRNDMEKRSVNSRDPRIRIGASLASSAASSSSTQSGYGALYSSSITGMQLGTASTGYSTVLVQNSFSEVNTDRRYYQPVSVALTVSYEASSRLSLRSGLNYSALVSSLSSGSEQALYSTTQVLHYLGLPLDLNYTLFRSGKISCYAGVGAMVQKAVAGSSATSFYKNSSLVEKTVQSVVEKQLQWSAGAFAGLSYELGGRAALQLECGTSYHFDNGSFVESIYKTKPLGLNVSLGVNFYLGR